MNQKQPNINFGAAILFLIFCLLFFVLFIRFVSIQSTGEAAGHSIAEKAKDKYSKSRVIKAKRGTIFDRNGEIVAEDSNSYTLVAILDEKMTSDEDHPNHVVDPENTAKELAKVIEMNESEIYQKLIKENLFQVEFGKAGKDISHEKKKEIEDLKLPGITFRTEIKRYYPNGIFASHLVGYVDTNEEQKETVGHLGIEESLNKQLTGTDGLIDYESDLWGYLLPSSEEKIKVAKNGNDVYLTIDKKIQTFLEDSLNKVEEEFTPKKMVAIVADPKTGEILAMAQRPTFHPKTREGIEQSWYNEAVELSFEPGSTMKIFTLAAAIEEGVFKKDEWFQSGSYTVTENSRPIRDHNRVGWGPITYLEGVQRSSNVAFAKIAKEKLGFEKLREYLTEFGLDQPTGIDLPNETSGKIAYQWPIEKVTTAFGQGTAITPIQQIQAATAIANNGKMVQPHVVDKIVDSNTGKVLKETKTKVKGTPISANTAKEVRDILETVISSPKGTGYEKYNIAGYEVAGKTGTAQIPDPNGGYLIGANDYVFSFLGMAPKDDPQLIMYVAVQQPDVDFYGNGSLPVSSIFKTVMKNSLQYLNIEPAKQDTMKANKIPNVTNMSLKDAQKELGKNGFEVIVMGKGDQIVHQLPMEGEKILEGEKVVIQTNGKLTVPDMIGWSLRDVMKVAKIADIKLNSVGSGYVVKQNLKAGSTIKSGDFLIVELETPQNQALKTEVSQDELSEEVLN